MKSRQRPPIGEVRHNRSVGDREEALITAQAMGYATIHEAVVSHREQGYQWREIGLMFGLTPRQAAASGRPLESFQVAHRNRRSKCEMCERMRECLQAAIARKPLLCGMDQHWNREEEACDGNDGGIAGAGGGLGVDWPAGVDELEAELEAECEPGGSGWWVRGRISIPLAET